MQRASFRLAISIIFTILISATTYGDADKLCRFGVNATSGAVLQSDFDSLRAGWYLNYWTSHTPPFANSDYANMIRLTQTGEYSYSIEPSINAVRYAATNRPGSVWFIGNEPDIRNYQDNLTPGAYAVAYHDLYALIKSYDPTSVVIAGNIAQATPVRLQYLDMVLAHYAAMYGEQMPVDGWAIHGYILNEVNCDANVNCWGAGIPPGIEAVYGQIVEASESDNLQMFVSRVELFRQWMADRGYRQKPLYVSEYGVLVPDMPPPLDFNASRVNQFMSKTIDFMLSATDAETGYTPDGNRLVQHFGWFSTTYHMNGRMFDTFDNGATYHMNDIGKNYQNYANSVKAVPEIIIQNLSAITSTSEITISATIANAGNNAEESSVDIRFYSGNPDGDGEVIFNTSAILAGCGDSETVTFVWKSEEPNYNIYVVAVDEQGIEKSESIHFPAVQEIYYFPFISG